MEEIEKLKNQNEFLRQEYLKLVDEYISFTCMCNKPIHFHMFKTQEEIKTNLLNRIEHEH